MNDAVDSSDKFFSQTPRGDEGKQLEYLVIIFDGAGNLIEWPVHYGRWSLLAAGLLFVGIVYLVSRSPRH